MYVMYMKFYLILFDSKKRR